MKYFLLPFIIFLKLNVFSQYVKIPDKEQIYDSIRNEYYYLDYGYKNLYIGDMVTPGTEMKKFVRHHYTGLILTFTGGVIGSVGTWSYLYGDDDYGIMIGVGSIMSLVGLIYSIEAPIHLHRAALIMDKNGVGISIDLD